MQSIMKLNIAKILITVLTIGLLTSSINGQTASLWGLMLVTTERPNLGFKIKGIYGMESLLKNFKGSVDFALFFPSTTKEIKYGRADIDFDGQYEFYKVSGFNFYMVGGLNFTYYQTKWIDTGESKEKAFKPGLNIGSGVNIDIGNKTKVFSEFKYVFNVYEQANICFGVLIEL